MRPSGNGFRKVGLPARAKLAIMSDGSLDAVSETVAQMYFAGQQISEISKALGLSPTCAFKRTRHPAVQRRCQELAEAQARSFESLHLSVTGRLSELAPKALDITAKHFKQSESGELNFAQERALVSDTLDRTGYPRQTAQKVQHQHSQSFDMAGIQKLTDMGKALLTTGALAGLDFLAMGKQIRGEVIDVPSEEDLSYG